MYWDLWKGVFYAIFLLHALCKIECCLCTINYCHAGDERQPDRKPGVGKVCWTACRQERSDCWTSCKPHSHPPGVPHWPHWCHIWRLQTHHAGRGGEIIQSFLVFFLGGWGSLFYGGGGGGCGYYHPIFSEITKKSLSHHQHECNA